MRNYIPDNFDLWEINEEKIERERERCPKCVYCGEPVFDAFAFYINGEWYHRECFESEYYVEVIED